MIAALYLPAAARQSTLPVPAIDQGRLEAIQWIAFACMVVDHVAVFFYGDPGWMRFIGRFAFPLFALVFSWRLAFSLQRRPHQGMLPTGHRLAVSGLWAQAFFWLMTNGLNEMNVMGSFLLAMAVISLTMAERDFLGLPWSWRTVLAFGLLFACHQRVDFGYAGLFLILGLFSFFRWGSRDGLVVAAVSLLLISSHHRVHAAFLAAPAAYWLLQAKASWLRVVKPLPNAFYWLYPMHILAILIAVNVIYMRRA